MKTIIEQLREDATNAELFEQAKEYALDYMKTVGSRPVNPSPEALDGLAVFEEELPPSGRDPDEILKMLHKYGSPATMAQTGGRYFGFVNGGAVPASLAAKWLGDVWDQNAVLYRASPIASVLEAVVEKWLVDLLRLPQGTAVGFVSGSTMASLCAIVTARDFLLKKQGYNTAKQGLFEAPALRVVVGEEVHASILKALSIAGLGTERVETVPSDANGAMDASKLPALDGNTLLILQAGNVNTGAFDDFAALCAKAKAAGAWVHVDGAFGLWAAASDRFRDTVKSLHLADSWSCDAHKTLNAPYDNGIVFCREREALTTAMQLQGAYIALSDKRDGMLYTPEMSRRARIVELWATLRSLGRSGVALLVEDLCDKARYFACALQSEGFAVPNEVCFNQVLVSVGEDSDLFLYHLQNSGVCWCGGSVWKGKKVVRVSVSSYRTTKEDIDASVRAFVEARKMSGNSI